MRSLALCRQGVLVEHLVGVGLHASTKPNLTPTGSKCKIGFRVFQHAYLSFVWCNWKKLTRFPKEIYFFLHFWAILSPPPQKRRKKSHLERSEKKSGEDKKRKTGHSEAIHPPYTIFWAIFGPKKIFLLGPSLILFLNWQTIDKYVCKNILKEICHLLLVGVGLGLVEVWLVSRQPPWPTFF